MKILNREKTDGKEKIGYKDIDIAEIIVAAALFVLSISYAIAQVVKVYLLLQGGSWIWG